MPIGTQKGELPIILTNVMIDLSMVKHVRHVALPTQH